MPLYGQNVCASDRGQRVGDDVRAGHVPARREARLVQHQRAGGVGDRPDRRRGRRGGGRCGGCRCGGRGRRRGRGCARPPRRRRPSPATPTRPCRRGCAACSGSATCCQAPRGGLAVAADDLEPGGLAEIGVLGAAVGRAEHAVGEVADAGSTRPGSGPARTAARRRRSGRPSGRRARRASAGAAARRTAPAPACSGTRNCPLGLRPSGPCCHESPIVRSELVRKGNGHRALVARRGVGLTGADTSRS